MAHKFPEPTRKSVTVQMQGQLKEFKFETTNVYEIANLDGLMVEHLIVAGSIERGTVYFRLRYEPFSEKMTLYHFNFQDKYKTISETKFLQPPSRLQCPDI